MRMKTYQADTLQEAFRAIKAELGPDAVILETAHARVDRTVKHPFGRPVVRVQAAVDWPARTPASRAERPREPALPGVPGCSVGSEAPSVFERTLASTLQLESEWDEAPSMLEERASLGIKSVDEHGPVREAGPARVRAELEARGCEPGTAAQLVADAVTEVIRQGSLSEDALRSGLRAVVVTRLRACSPQGDDEERAACVAVIGPTGAGKTSALSKLMTRYVRQGVSNLTVVKVERERAPGIDPLQVTAAECGARIEVVRTRRELTVLLRRDSLSDVTLIDTPGLSALDQAAVGAARDWLGSDSRMQVHLVLPAQTIRQDFEDLMMRYAGLPIHRLLFTKLDETTRHGRMLEIALRCRLPLSYLAGSRCPDGGIEEATPDRVAGLVCGWSPEEVCDGGKQEAWTGRGGRRSSRGPMTTFEGGQEWKKL